MSIFKEFNIVPASSPESGDVITNAKDIVSSGMWENGAAKITSFFTSSTQSGSSGDHYLDVYAQNPQKVSTAKAQFSIAYGHFNGSGSLGKQGVVGNRASAAIYRQLSQTLLGPTDSQFKFAGSGAHIKPKYVYAISIARQQLREKMDPGNWELELSGSDLLLGGNGDARIRLIDDSGATTNPAVNQGGRVFNVVSGSIRTGTAVLTSNVGGDNNSKFYSVISSSLGSAYFAARREEVITSQHYFCRIPNKEFNFSSNPTFATASDGSLTQATFFKNPKTFITQVGL